MRIWIAGPRLLGGLVRPGISFDLGKVLRRPTLASATTDFVYVIEGDHGRVKVGWGVDPEKRCRDLQTGSPHRLWVAHAVPTFGNGYTIEQEAHRILDPHRGLGEWFAVSPEMAVAAIYGAAARSGCSLKEPVLEEEKKPPLIAWPTTSFGWIVLILVILIGIGMIMRG